MNFPSRACRRHKEAIPLQNTILTILIISLISLATLSCSSFRHGRLLTWEEYIENPRTDPYILELNTIDGSLFYYGAFHNLDPGDPQFEDIEQKWEQFRPTNAFCEGRIWPLEESRTKAIRMHGEQGLITFLAARDGIPIQCIDPPFAEQTRYLRKFFPPLQIKIYYVLRQANINKLLGREDKNLDDTHYLLRKMEKIKRLKCFPSTLLQFEYMVSKLFPELDNWQDIPYTYFRSSEKGRFLPDVHRKLNEYRDYIMIKKVTKALKKGERVFAVVGRSHVFKQQSILRSLIL
ncbi:MAG: TraB/GumN family protein [Candidatus Aminicenantes bacterium]|nr:TraB/GumN family protein [Candidatus Aminicenantes bacterium]